MYKLAEEVKSESAPELAIELNIKNNIRRVKVALLNWMGFKFSPRIFVQTYI